MFVAYLKVYNFSFLFLFIFHKISDIWKQR